MGRGEGGPPPEAVCAAGIFSLALAMGIGRFAFTPMLPLMVRDGSLSGNDPALLASANYLGYLIGSLSLASLPGSASRHIRFSLLGIVVLTAGMGAGHSFLAWAVFRFAAGVLSAWALIATSAWALKGLSRAGRPALAGVVFSGVGVGIAIAGLFCVVAAQPQIGSSRLWLEMGVLAALLAAPALLFIGRSPSDAAPAPDAKPMEKIPSGLGALVVCYGCFGFGYILPATFLPSLARGLVADPRRFGLAWPLFGLAAALSTLLAGWGLRRVNRLKIWSGCHLLMAAGALLPSVWRTGLSIAVSALLVGGTFMIVTMVGLQEARARAPAAPTALLGRMTGAFAFGQILGPLASAALTYLPITPASALDLSLRCAAVGLAISAIQLGRMASRTLTP
jgi:hypothetical protein